MSGPTSSFFSRRLALLTATVLVIPLAACDSGGGDGGDGAEGTAEAAGGIKVWIQEDLPDRVAATQAIVDDYTEATGTEVELVGASAPLVLRDVGELVGPGGAGRVCHSGSLLGVGRTGATRAGPATLPPARDREVSGARRPGDGARRTGLADSPP